MLSKRRFLTNSLGAAVAACAPLAAAWAQTYPVRPIRLIVPFPAGGPVDVMGRLVAQYLSTALGQQMIVDNRPGAGSTLGGRAAAAAEPDGYTLLVGSSGTLAAAPVLYKKIGYDPAKSFTPVGLISSVPFILIAGPKVPARSVAELIAYAKANPGKLNFGVSNGAAPHMLAAWFRELTGTDIVIVPYKGAATVISDLVGGQMDLTFETTSVMLEHVRAGTVRGLAVTTPTRLPDLPEVPTMIESGVPDFVAGSWTGIVAPAATAKPIIARLNVALDEGLNSAAMRERFKQLAAQALPGSPKDFAAFLAHEAPKWAAMAKLIHIDD